MLEEVDQSRQETTLSGPAHQESEARLALVRRELQAVYRELEADIAAAAPTCVLSGRCCQFQSFDHTLFVSEIEADLLWADAPEPCRELDEGLTCPWQDSQGRCAAREARPLGCRVFFCDASYTVTQFRLAEIYIAKLKQIAREHDLPWNYAPLHQHLRRLFGAGLQGPPRPPDQ